MRAAGIESLGPINLLRNYIQFRHPVLPANYGQKFMKFSFSFIGTLFIWSILCVRADAAAIMPVVPLNQDLVTVDYMKDGKQSGCGLRATGSTRDDVWLNVLVNVFMQEPGVTFGMLKVVARKINMENGAPVLQNGKLSYSSIGKIRKAWIRTDSGVQPTFYRNGESSHSDGYMTSMEFASTMELLSAITHTSFLVALVRNEDGTPDVFRFDKKISPAEAEKLSVCMKNLRDNIEKNMGANGL
jgi:hypothetical protein